mmetsp:Transcript_51074/g.89117  ORF Transcript_51074/g.89117 Transcript_51074/m.89117 type:complete len:123 (-) Transcript_51074:13-381(-)
MAPAQELAEPEDLRPVVYSSLHHENVSTIGRTNLQGMLVDGVSEVAKMLLSKVGSSIYHHQRQRQAQVQAAAGGMMVHGMAHPHIMAGHGMLMQGGMMYGHQQQFHQQQMHQQLVVGMPPNM